MRPAIVAFSLLAISVAGRLANGLPSPTRADCPTPPVEPCTTQHGRLSTQNGKTPTIWVVGTTRRLHVQNEPDSFLPRSVLPYLNMTSPDQSYVFGDFTVCPIGPDKPGHMREVCVADAKKLVVQNLMNRWPLFRVRSTWLRDRD